MPKCVGVGGKTDSTGGIVTHLGDHPLRLFGHLGTADHCDATWTRY
jgi:hypothetical protein